MVILSNLVSLVVGAVLWHKAGAADREQDLQAQFNHGRFEGQVEGRKAGFADAVSAQRIKDSARAKKAARTRQAKRGAK